MPQMPIIWVKYDPPSGLLVNKYAHANATLTSQNMNIGVRRLKLRLHASCACLPERSRRERFACVFNAKSSLPSTFRQGPLDRRKSPMHQHLTYSYSQQMRASGL